METRNRTKKGLIIGVTAAALALLLLAGFTLAYLTDRRETLNVLNIGQVKIALEEKGFAAQAEEMDEDAVITTFSGGTADEYTLVTMNNVLPGQPINKDPVIKNLSPEAVYIRVQLLDSQTDGEVIDLESDPYTLLNATLAEDWELCEDGYIYYTQPVQPTGTGDGIALFVKQELAAAIEGYDAGTPYTMMLPTTLSNSDIDNTDPDKLSSAVNMFVVAEAIQARGVAIDFTKLNAASPWPGDAVVSPASR